MVNTYKQLIGSSSLAQLPSGTATLCNEGLENPLLLGNAHAHVLVRLKANSHHLLRRRGDKVLKPLYAFEQLQVGVFVAICLSFCCLLKLG